MVAPREADVYACTTPSLRRCWSDAMRAEDHSMVERYRTPKLVVRRDGSDLRSRFVAIWEPIGGYDVVARVKDLSPGDGGSAALEIRTSSAAGGKRILVAYSNDPTQRTEVDGVMSVQGRYAAFVSDDSDSRIALYDCSHLAMDGLSVSIPRRPSLPVHSVTALGNGKYVVALKGRWDQTTDGQTRAFGQPELFILTQKGGHHRAFPVNSIRVVSNKTLLDCSRHPGFEYDADKQLLQEVFKPFLSTQGEATVSYPSRAWLRQGGDRSDDWRIQSADRVRLNR
jgi:hypothetical protein